LKSPLTNPEGKSLMANHSLFKLSVVALLVSTLAACGKTEDVPAAQLTAPVAAASPQRQRPPVRAAASAPVDYSAQLAAPIAEYKQYVSSELEGLLSQSKAFAAAIKAGDLKKRKGLYAIHPPALRTDRADCRAVLRHGRGD
jgi:iron uptake system component EfeO